MFQATRDLKAIMTPKEFRNEMIGGAFAVLMFAMFFAALWIMSPA